MTEPQRTLLSPDDLVAESGKAEATISSSGISR